MARATLYFGFGGSGITTLMGLNSLLAEDPVWRYRACEDVYYVIADTETDQLERFKRDYQRKFGREAGNNLLSIELSQGLITLGPRVHRYFVEPFASNADPDIQAAKDRLYAHWWVTPEGVPFTAPMVRNLADGAGQCPPASFFLAWSYLHLFQKKLAGFVTTIQRTRASHENTYPLRDMRVLVVAGMAGGTGRGCWAPLAFKLRETLLAEGVQISPEAYLFDASCFPELFLRSRDQETQLKVNALTGFSELSVWMRGVGTDLGRLAYRYSLPSQQHPGAESQDALNTRKSGHDELSSPVDRAFLIFGDSQFGGLGQSGAYFEMLSKALYTKLTLSQAKAKQVNEHDPFRSVGALTYEINANRLRRYFESLARIRFAKRLVESDESVAEEIATQLISAMGLDFHVRRKEDIIQNAEGNLLQRACHELLRLREDAIRQALGELNQDYDFGRDALREAIAPSLEATTAAVAAVLPSSNGDLRTALKNAINSAYEGQQGAFRSLGTVSQLLARVRTRLSRLGIPPAGYLVPERLQEEIESQWEAEGAVPRDSLVAEIRKREGREHFGLMGERFNTKELADIEGRAREELCRWHYPSILRAIQEHVAAQVRELDEWQQRCEALLESIGRVERVLLYRLGDRLSDTGTQTGMSLAEMFDKLFTDRDRPEQSLLVGDDGSERLYRRELKPVLSRGAEMELLDDDDAVVVRQDAPLDDRVLGYLFGEDPALAMLDLATGLEQEIETAVQLGARFLEGNFSFAPALERLEQAWVDRLNATQGSQDQHEELKRRYRQYYGEVPTFELDRYKARPLEESLPKLLISATALCRPYATFQEAAVDDKRLRGDVDVAVLAGLPRLYGKLVKSSALEDKVREYFQERHYADISVAIDIGENEEERSPFLLTVYTSEGVRDLGQFASLDSWRGDPYVYDAVMAAEDAQGRSIFERGIGYVDPVYVRHEELRALRWRPWLPEERDSREENATLDALLHGLFIPDEQRRAVFEARGWQFPLIREKDRRHYIFARKALHHDGGGHYEPDAVDTPWEPERYLEQNISNLYSFFAAPENVQYRNRIVEEMELFWGQLAVRLGFGKETEAYQPLVQAYLEHLDQRRRKTEEEDQAATWARLCDRLKQWRDQGIGQAG